MFPFVYECTVVALVGPLKQVLVGLEEGLHSGLYVRQ